MSSLLQVGDVFYLPEEVHERAHHNNTIKGSLGVRPTVDTNSHIEFMGDRIVSVKWKQVNDEGWTKEEWVRIDKTPQPGILDGEFLVIWTGMDGGGTGHGPHDVYPDGHHVQAIRLNDDGTYSPEGQRIEFYQTGCFRGMITEAKAHRKMSMRFA